MKKNLAILKEEVDALNAEAGPKLFDAKVLVADGKGPHVPFDYKVKNIKATSEDQAYDIASEAALRLHRGKPYATPRARVLDVDCRPAGDDFDPKNDEPNY